MYITEIYNDIGHMIFIYLTRWLASAILHATRRIVSSGWVKVSKHVSPGVAPGYWPSVDLG